jgi:beta-galactosidase
MGNSSGGLADYWDKFWSPDFPRLQGGFIWDWVDQGLVLGNKASGCFGYGGDFGDLPNSKQFCINGILGPDRIPHPIALEAASLQAPLTVSGEIIQQSDDYTLNLIVKNRRSFVSLDDVTLTLSLGCSYKTPISSTSTAVTVSPSVRLHLKDYPTILPSAEGKVALTDMQAGDVFSNLVRSLIVQLDTNASDCFTASETEYWVEVTASSSKVSHDFELIHVTLQPRWLSALIVHIATPLIDVFSSSKSSPATSSNNNRSYKITQSIDESTGNVEVIWGVRAGRAVIGSHCGRLIYFSPAGVELHHGVDLDASGNGIELMGTNVLTAPVDLCLYRAPTDNDRGGDSMSYHQQWLAAGYHCLVRQEGSVRVQVEESLTPDIVSVLATWTLIPSQDVIMDNTSIDCSIRYKFSSSGQIEFTFSTSVPSHLPPVPRVGLRTALNSQLDHVEWLGLGPHEAYDDRKAMVYLDHFTSTVEDLHTDYIFPQECGRRMDPRWVTFRNSSGMGFEALPCRHLPSTSLNDDAEESPYRCSGQLSVGGEGTDRNQVWGWSASRYSAEQLADTDHNHELQPDSNAQVHVHMDRVMMGVAGYDSWSPNVPSEFIIPVGKTITGQVTWTPVLPVSDQRRG